MKHTYYQLICLPWRSAEPIDRIFGSILGGLAGFAFGFIILLLASLLFWSSPSELLEGRTSFRVLWVIFMLYTGFQGFKYSIISKEV